MSLLGTLFRMHHLVLCVLIEHKVDHVPAIGQDFVWGQHNLFYSFADWNSCLPKLDGEMHLNAKDVFCDGGRIVYKSLECCVTQHSTCVDTSVNFSQIPQFEHSFAVTKLRKESNRKVDLYTIQDCQSQEESCLFGQLRQYTFPQPVEISVFLPSENCV